MYLITLADWKKLYILIKYIHMKMYTKNRYNFNDLVYRNFPDDHNIFSNNFLKLKKYYNDVVLVT